MVHCRPRSVTRRPEPSIVYPKTFPRSQKLPRRPLIQPSREIIPAPVWFEPSAVISVTPLKTKWLLMSNILVLAWFVLSVALIDSRSRLQQFLLVLMAVGLLHASVGIFLC